MQVPLIDRLNDLQAGFNSLQNPSLPSQIASSLQPIQSVSVAYNFCKWGAVILALVATFGSIINKVTIFIIRLRNKAPSLQSFNFDDDFDDDFTSSNDEDDDTSSSEFEDEEEEQEREAPASSSSYEFFRVRGSDFQSENTTYKRRRSVGDIFSLSEIANSRSVVKLWDSIGFGLGLDFDDFDDSEDGEVMPPPLPATSTASPAVMVSAGEGACGKLALKIWDTRLRQRKPMVVAEWGPTTGKTVRVESGGVQKVYVRDDGRYGVTVGDMRNVSAPLRNVTESDADIWWDADASDESYGEEQSLLHPT